MRSQTSELGFVNTLLEHISMSLNSVQRSLRAPIDSGDMKITAIDVF